MNQRPNRLLAITAIRLICLMSVLLCRPFLACADGDDYASIRKFLHENFDHKNAGMVVALVDEHGSKTFSAGKLDNGTDDEVNADTVFEIGSVTKTFTALLLVDMVDRGEMKFDDPVAKYLPDSVKLQTHGGKEITLLNLAAQDSGLPFNADNHEGADWAERFRTYTVGKMYEFLSSYRLAQDPGAKFQYSNIGMGLLGHAMERKSGKDFEALVIERICRPLHLDSTCVTLTPELKARLATGHDAQGRPSDNFELHAIAGAGAIRSTADDLVRYVSAQLGLSQSKLTPLMEQTHQIRHDDAHLSDEPFQSHTALPWYDDGVLNPAGSQLLGHAGGTSGYNSFVGFDLKRRIGVVVLTNQTNIHSSALGWRILQHARLVGLDPTKMMPMRELEGAGFALDFDAPSGMVRITKVLANSPAAKAGLTAGLAIRSINGVPMENKSLAECAALIRGQAGTKLMLELADATQNPAMSIELTREKFLLDE